jgi:hypothetical protein
MMAMVGLYSFLGPLAGAALGGDFHIALTFLHIPTTVAYLASAIGFLLLPAFMFCIGRELLRWAPRGFNRAESVGLRCSRTLAGWNIRTLAALLVVAAIFSRLVGLLGVRRLRSCDWFSD